MSVKKKLDPSKVSQSISIPSPAKQDPAAHVAEPVSAPKAAEPSQLNAKGRYETSFRYSELTRERMLTALEVCQERPDLKARVIQKTYLELCTYALSLLDSKGLKDAYYGMPELGRATVGSPLRLSGEFHERIMTPLIQKYSDALKSTKGANVSRMVILGIHYMDSILQRDKEEYLNYVSELCDRQYDEGLNIC